MRAVTSLQNETVKLVRSLEMRKVRRETGLFVAEGAAVLISGREHGVLPKILIVRSGTSLAGELGALVRAAEDRGADLIEASDPVMEKLSTKDNPQAVIGVFEQRWRSAPNLTGDVRPGTTWVALEHVRDPGNLGTIIRTADAAGAAGVILIGTCCDPYSHESTRATMGSIFAVPLCRLDDDAGLTMVRNWPGDRVGTHLSGRDDFRTVAYRSPTLIVMGGEGPGLTDDLAAACSRLVKIPMAGHLDSLNLAIATALMLYQVQGPRLTL